MGKSKKSRTAPPAVQQVMMPYFMNFMPGMSPAMPSNWPGMGMGMGMAPGTVTALAMENRGESSSSESESFEHKRKDLDADQKILTNSANTMYKLPDKRLRQLIYALVPDLETLITELNKEMRKATNSMQELGGT